MFDDPEDDPYEAENVADGLGYAANDHLAYGNGATGHHFPFRPHPDTQES